MRALVIVACLAVLAVIGIYVLRNYLADSMKDDMSAMMETSRAKLFQEAGAEPGDIEKVRSFCKETAKKPEELVQANDPRLLEISVSCKLLGYQD